MTGLNSAATLMTQLGQVLSLDEQTISTMIWPALQEISRPSEVKQYLESFIGPDPFTAAYLQFRFPPSSSSRPVVTVVPTVPVKATLPRFGQPQPVVVAPQPTVRAPSISTVSTSSHSTRIAIASEPADELLRIESALRSFKGKGKACHCAARDHELSLYTPICPKCSLILCAINSPSSPCPSCRHSPLLSSTATASYIADLTSRRDAVIERETNRLRRIEAEDERERHAVVFPGLNDGLTRAPGVGAGGMRGYSSTAGGGPSLASRIDRAYEEGRTLGGRPFGNRMEGNGSGSSSAGGKVLRLDLKTKKVMKVTQQKKVVNKGLSSKKENVTPVLVDEDEYEGVEVFIDENDDGVRSTTEQPHEVSVTDRVFHNPLLSPQWVEEELVEPVAAAVFDVVAEVVKGISGTAVAVVTGEVEKKKRKMIKKSKGDVIV